MWKSPNQLNLEDEGMTNDNVSTELRTERLLLRPFRLEDVDDVDDVFGYASDWQQARETVLGRMMALREQGV